MAAQRSRRSGLVEQVEARDGDRLLHHSDLPVHEAVERFRTELVGEAERLLNHWEAEECSRSAWLMR